MTNETPIVAVSDLSVRFGGLIAVNALHFEAERGRITSIIGPNGAGKSTLFNLISGAIRPTQGDIFFDGQQVTGTGPQAMQRLGIARSFQITNLFFELPVYENVRLAAQVLEPALASFVPTRRSRRAARKAEELLERLSLASKAHVLAGNLSHGEQRRLEIALALAGEPRLLLLDEPTQGMSHGDTDETAALIKSLAGERSILLIEHDIGVVMGVSDHVVVMHQGTKIAEGPPADVRANADVQIAYFGRA
jgi:branched-chain amino acid transport system ATP-binding protein